MNSDDEDLSPEQSIILYDVNNHILRLRERTKYLQRQIDSIWHFIYLVGIYKFIFR
jgi:hypothetical protein